MVDSEHIIVCKNLTEFCNTSKDHLKATSDLLFTVRNSFNTNSSEKTVDSAQVEHGREESITPDADNNKETELCSQL